MAIGFLFGVEIYLELNRSRAVQPCGITKKCQLYILKAYTL